MTTQLHWTAGVHHDGSALYVSNRNPKLGDRVTIKLRAPASAPITRVFLRTAPDGENHYEAMHEESRVRGLTWWKAELRVHMPSNPYRFKVITSDGAYYLTQAGISRSDAPEWTDFKILADYATPAWTHESVFYQIFPDRFYNGDPATDVKPGEWRRGSHATQMRPWGAPPLQWKEGGNLDFYGGDLAGIAQKLGYLDDLGVNALYLTPIFSALTNHRYDVMDFFTIDPHVGGNAGLAALRQALDECDMRVMLDVTLNHCGAGNPWFARAQADPHADTAEYFTFYERPHHYEMWLGVRSLPKLNYRSEKLRDVMYRAPESVLRTWLRAPYRIDGWRLDVANMQARQGAIQLSHKVGRQIRQAVKAENPAAYLIGEHFYDATSYLQGDELDATMNYSGFTVPLWRWLAGKDLGSDYRPEVADLSLLPAEAMVEQWTQFRAPLPWVVARHQFNLLDSHDTERMLRKLGGDRAMLKLAGVILMTYPGTPSVYYGTEIGMDGGKDPDNRRCMPWDESHWDHNLRSFFQHIIKLRRTHQALCYGGYQALYAQDGLVVFQRQSVDKRVVVVGYRGPADLNMQLIPIWHSGLHDGALLVDILSGTEFRVENGLLRLGGLRKGSALILEQR